MRAFDVETFRSIGQSLGRFLAILGIVALGCGFYAGLRMSGPDMRIAADRFYDGTNLYDIRILSELGFGEDQVALVQDIEGVRNVMPAKSTDVMTMMGEDHYAVRVSTFDSDAAKASTCDDGCTVFSSNESYINRPVLATGRWPNNAGECLLSADRVMVSPINLGDKVEVVYGAQSLEGVLSRSSFTVVGLVHSSLYVSAVTQGSTTLGSGVIEQFMFVTEGAFDHDCPYTELFVTVDGAQDVFSGSPEYDEIVDEVAKRIKASLPAMAEQRLQEVKRKAHDEIDEKADEYESKKAEAETELADAQSKLVDAKQQLDSGEVELADAQNKLDQGKQELANQQEQAYSALDDARAKLESTQAQLDAGQAQLDNARPQVESYVAMRPSLESQLSDAKKALDDISKAKQSLAQMEQQLKQLEQGSEQYKELQARIALLKKQIPSNAEQAQLEESVARLQAAIKEGDKQLEEFNEKQRQISNGYAQLSEGWTQYYQQEEEAVLQLESAQIQLNQSELQLDDARTQLAQSTSEYESGLQEYNANERKAASELADASIAIANARADVNDMEPPKMYVLERSKNHGVASLKADSERIDNIARVFPFIFFLVAALVALTTMTRMVDENRIVIGTLKALGYSKSSITGKYLLYAGMASIAGAVLGIAVLSQVLPVTISKAYAIIYNVPSQPLPLPIEWSIALDSAGMGIGVTLLATWAAMWATLREQPAQLMLPRAPKAGKRIFLEHIGAIWNRLSFSWKVTLRNLLRYKKRLFMTVVGIAGCTALLLTGFGLHDAIWDIIDKHFDNVVKYHVVVRLDDDAVPESYTIVEEEMKDGLESTILARAADLNKQVGSASADPLGVTVTVMEDTSDFALLVSARNRQLGNPIVLDDNSVIVNEKLARTLSVNVGDTILIFDQDEIGNAEGDGVPLKITGVMEYYVGNTVLVGSAAYEKAYKALPVFNSIYADCTSDMNARLASTDRLHDLDNVQTVSYNDETIESYRTMLQSVNMIVVVLVVAAAALAFIVLYNLTNINIMERRREIASLKVLGFTVREVDSYIFREIVILTMLGALSGLLLGVGMEAFVVESAEVDYVMFGRDIHPLSFVLAFVLTLGFSMLVMVVMRFKLRAVNMAESLKSID